jgi:hypothetical protein
MRAEASAKTAAVREREAVTSAGRAAGYCWVEHPDGGAHCTRPPGHRPRSRHVDYYNRTRGEFD